jgi:hypothetical protein
MVKEETLEGLRPRQADGANVRILRFYDQIDSETRGGKSMNKRFVKHGIRISDLSTVIELIKVECGTKLIFTEQGAFFVEVREHGTNVMLDALGKGVEGEVGTW